MKKIIKLTENDLHTIVENAVKRILKEAPTKPNILTNDLSAEDYIQAWEDMWKNLIDGSTARRKGLNLQLYYLYKNDPYKIKTWFARHGMLQNILQKQYRNVNDNANDNEYGYV